MGGSAGQWQSKWNEVEHCSGTKALAKEKARWTEGRELTISRGAKRLDGKYQISVFLGWHDNGQAIDKESNVK